MKITAGKRGDAAREAKDKAENKFYWDAYNYSAGRQRMKDEYQSRKSSASDDVRRQIDRLISDGYAKQIFEDDVDVKVGVGYGNKSYHSAEENSRRGENPEQVNVQVSNERYGAKVPFKWEWRARFGWDWHKEVYAIENDVSSYNFDSSSPNDIEYFAACAEILKALSKLNWNKILTTNYFEGMENFLVDSPARNYDGRPRYESDYESEIRADAVEEAITEWKKGDKWLYVGISNRYHEDNPRWDTVSSDNLSDGPGYYRYVGETDKFYKVEYMSGNEGRRRMQSDEPAQKDTWQYKSKVRKADFENSVYYPITWWGRA